MSKTMTQGRWCTVALLALAAALVASTGCHHIGEADGSPSASGYWDDDDCMGSSSGWGQGGAMAAGGGSGVAVPEGARAISEADIVQLDGDLLYAVSRTAGFNVVDITDPSLTLLAQYPLAGTPFEMYLHGGAAYVMSDDEIDHRTRIQAFAEDGQGSFTYWGSTWVHGHVSDSRIVGEVLYLVTHEDHLDCADCPDWPTTRLTSLSFGQGAAPEQVDTLAFQQHDGLALGWRRSMMATAERVYVAGVEWDGVSPTGSSTIQAIDISDPGGDLVEGAAVEAAGMILNRWQMDEYDGVLRVLSQPGVWAADEPPVVQTFQVSGQAGLTPIAHMSLALDTPESLRSVRFDAGRAYAITAQATEPYDPSAGAEVPPPSPPVDACGYSCDPLVVLDLSDPAKPMQLGSLEMPGWIFHLVPRGDRLFALGFEATYPLGRLTVSLFDVSDGDSPTMLDRVSFGDDLSGLSEDQNRIHKAFQLFDEQGLIAVPYGSWQWQSMIECYGDSCWGEECWDNGDWARSGAVQLIDFDADGLTARGVAQMDEWARRALLRPVAGPHLHLLTMSDAGIDRFDISDRDTPELLSQAIF